MMGTPPFDLTNLMPEMGAMLNGISTGRFPATFMGNPHARGRSSNSSCSCVCTANHDQHNHQSFLRKRCKTFRRKLKEIEKIERDKKVLASMRAHVHRIGNALADADYKKDPYQYNKHKKLKRENVQKDSDLLHPVKFNKYQEKKEKLKNLGARTTRISSSKKEKMKIRQRTKQNTNAETSIDNNLIAVKDSSSNLILKVEDKEISTLDSYKEKSISEMKYPSLAELNEEEICTKHKCCAALRSEHEIKALKKLEDKFTETFEMSKVIDDYISLAIQKNKNAAKNNRLLRKQQRQIRIKTSKERLENAVIDKNTITNFDRTLKELKNLDEQGETLPTVLRMKKLNCNKRNSKKKYL